MEPQKFFLLFNTNCFILIEALNAQLNQHLTIFQLILVIHFLYLFQVLVELLICFLTFGTKSFFPFFVQKEQYNF